MIERKLRFPFFLAGTLMCAMVHAAEAPSQSPAVWGYGVNDCSAFLAAAAADASDSGADAGSLLRYREWLAGLVTGLNLATGRELAPNGHLGTLLEQVRQYCQAHPREDFFNASLQVISSSQSSQPDVPLSIGRKP